MSAPPSSAPVAREWWEAPPAPVASPFVPTEDTFTGLRLALLTDDVPWGRPMPEGVEFAAPSYARAPVGPTVIANEGEAPVIRVNTLPIVWPVAREDWGAARSVALVDGPSGVVIATDDPPEGPFLVQQGDQARIAARGLVIGLSFPRIGRPYNVGRYNAGPYSTAGAGRRGRPWGRSVWGRWSYSRWPIGGAVVAFDVLGLAYAWKRHDDACGPWPVLPLQSGTCCGAAP